jgi:hypothetical protein
LAPPNRGRINSTHNHGTCVPVEEPSTASIADMGRIAGQSQLDLYSYLTERVQPLSASTPL